MLSVFVGDFFRRPSLLFLQFFRVLSVLGFLAGEFFAANSELGVRGFLGEDFWAQKPLFFVPKTAKKKFSLS